MTTLNGYLHQSQPGDNPRFTKGQKDMIGRGAYAALALFEPQHPGTPYAAEVKAAIKTARDALRAALERLPDDRSCWSCDFRLAGWCHQWVAEIPGEAFAAGCERWQDDGTPF